MLTVSIDDLHPRPDRIEAVVRCLNDGGLVAIATDTTWAIVCDPFQRSAVQRLNGLRGHMAGSPERSGERTDRPLALLCSDLSDVGIYVLLDQPRFRIVRRLLPGPYTIILPASRQVPRLLQSTRRSVGIRIPAHPVPSALTSALGNPLLTTTARRADGELAASSTEIRSDLARHVAMVVESEPFVPEPSTVLDLTGDEPIVVRAGKGEIDSAWGRA